MELLILIPTVGFALACQRLQRSTYSAGLLIAVSSMVVTLFLASLIDMLKPASVMLMLAGTILFVSEGYRYFRDRTPIPVPIGVFVILCTAYWLVHSDSSLFYYDEYSHWGVYLREMLAQNALWGADTNAMHPRYLPGTSLWQYLFALFSQKPEGAAYLAQFALLVTPLMVLWQGVRWKDYYWHAGILLLIIILLFNFGHGFTSLYVDHLLGTWFAGILLNFLVDRKGSSVYQLTTYLLPLLVLVLIKTTGVLFALADAGIIALLLLMMRTPDGALIPAGERWRRAITFPVVTLMLCISVLSVWNMNRDTMGIEAGAGTASSLVGNIASRESVLTEVQQAELKSRFLRVLLHQQISKDEVSAQYNAFSYPVMEAYKDYFRLTTASLMAFSLIAIFLLWHTTVSKAERRSWVVAAGSVWLAAAVYVAGLYFGYLYSSVSDYALLLSSYVRYAHSMLLPVLLLCFAPLLPVIAGARLPLVKLSENISVERRSLVFVIVLAAMLVFEQPYLERLYKPQPPHDFRLQTEPVTDRLRGITGDATMWVFLPNDVTNGVLGQMLQYQLSPGRVYVEESADALMDDPLQLREELRNWEYIWFANRNPAFQAASEALVGQDLGDGLFRIEKVGAEVQFIPVADAL